MMGFAIRQYFGAGWDTDTVLVALSLLSILTGIHILFQTLEQMLRAQAYDHQIAPPRQPVTVNLNSTYGLSLPAVQIDVVRGFCLALISFPNTTEDYWLDGNPSKWQSLGGIGRSDFVECKKHLRQIGALKLKNPNAKNSKDIVADRHILARRAGGRL